MIKNQKCDRNTWPFWILGNELAERLRHLGQALKHEEIKASVFKLTLGFVKSNGLKGY